MILAAWSCVGAARMAAVVDFPQTLGALGAGAAGSGAGVGTTVVVAAGAFGAVGVTATGAGSGAGDATTDTSTSAGLDSEESFLDLVGVGDHTFADALSAEGIKDLAPELSFLIGVVLMISFTFGWVINKHLTCLCEAYVSPSTVWVLGAGWEIVALGIY